MDAGIARSAAKLRRSRTGTIFGPMTWIKTLDPSSPDHPEVGEAYAKQRALYPPEYAVPTAPGKGGAAGIVASHSLLPDVLHHAFAAYGVLLSPDLPLERRHHEMIATVVSVTNRCRY